MLHSNIDSLPTLYEIRNIRCPILWRTIYTVLTPPSPTVPSLSTALVSLSCFLRISDNMTLLYSKNKALATTDSAAVTTIVALAVTEYWPTPMSVT